ncbi:MAG TPA: bifunctional UDP-N-acetylmuramoyl-tripeptide:D-alanyl-D-alanine ligase/alanine racemase, partial [Chitinophagales bacterium]|nr:bifunctional UDP-N-acetylmuramoyl-tripeptide:D-alanyl-D-alanine ligase/alanine racemase [Chitinophagales bacterium]
MRYTITEIASIVQGVFIQKNSNDEVQYVSTDTRQIIHAAANLFFCLVARNNGHQYIISAYYKGIRNFIVSEKINIENYPDANFILVEKSITALQQFAKFHRAQFKIPVIGI